MIRFLNQTKLWMAFPHAMPVYASSFCSQWYLDRLTAACLLQFAAWNCLSYTIYGTKYSKDKTLIASIAFVAKVSRLWLSPFTRRLFCSSDNLWKKNLQIRSKSQKPQKFCCCRTFNFYFMVVHSSVKITYLIFR